MNRLLKNDLDALFQEAMPRLGFLEKRGIAGRMELIYGLAEKYLGPRYDELETLKGEAR